jgi:acylphosphatase
VEVVAEGDASRLDELGRWLEQGPRSARVEQVERSAVAGADRYMDFDIAWRAPE